MKKDPPVPDQKDQEAFRKLTVTTYQPPDAANLTRTVPIPASRQKADRNVHWNKFFTSAAALLIIPIFILGAWNLRNFSYASQKLFKSDNPLGLLFVSPLNKTANDRVNILLVGYSNDDPGHAGAELTDSIMILSLDAHADSGYLLNVPRDLYVNIPGNGMAKINEAFQYGESTDFDLPGYSDGGMGLLEKVIDDHLGIETHYYALINYTAVRDVVNALDGITVTIDSPDPRGIYDPNFKPSEGGPLKLENGRHTIDGETALKLTRARGATHGSYGFPRSDFNRIENQQRILAAIKSDLSWRLLFNPLKNGRIFEAVADNIATDAKLSEVIPLYRLQARLPNDKLKRVSLNNGEDRFLLQSYTTPNGQSALVPSAGLHDYSQIQAFIDELSR